MYQLTWKDKQRWLDATARQPPIAAPPPSSIKVASAALLFWEEHCVECAVPTCYASCPLYVARADRKCARFPYGIFPNPACGGLFPFAADVFFRRWAKLESHWPAGTPRLFRPAALRGTHVLLRAIESSVSALASACAPIEPRRRLNGAFTCLRAHLFDACLQTEAADLAGREFLYFQYYYPGEVASNLQLEIAYDRPMYRTQLTVRPGWNEHLLPCSELPRMRAERTGRIRVWPVDDAELRLVFTWADLVRLAKPLPPEHPSSPAASGAAASRARPASSPTSRPAAKVKCVAWDLDNTLWDGVIGDAGPAGVTPFPEAVELIKKLDSRGIVQTVVSKNDFELAWNKVKSLSLDEYFLYPAINWGRKSESLKRIADELNVNLDSFAVLDDSVHERDEIAAALPQVRLFDPECMPTLLARDEFRVPVTAESRRRRQAYAAEASRKTIAAAWGDDFDGFLKNCRMVMTIGRPGTAEAGRCLELLQRSNQFNLSARRYSEEQFATLLASEEHEAWYVRVHDKFGDHGIVAVLIVRRESAGPLVIDLVMSCRVAQKKVDETFISWYARRAKLGGASALRAHLHITERNRPLREVFASLPFHTTRETATEKMLSLDLSREVAVPDIIEIQELAGDAAQTSPGKPIHDHC